MMVGSGMLPAIADVTVHETAYDTIVIECDFSSPRIEQVNREDKWYDRITMDNLPNSCDVQSACLPVKPLKILMPYGRIVDSITVVAGQGISMGAGFHVEKGHNIIPFGSHQATDDGCVDKSFFSDQLFTVVGTHIFRGYAIFFVNLHPVHYTKDSGEIIWYNHMTVQVKTQPTSVTTSIRTMQQDKDLVTKQVVNPQMLKTYEDAPQSKPLDLVEYVIITNEELRDATGSYTFQDLVAAKQNQGMTAGIFTVEEIIANADYWVNGAWGDNNPSNPFYQGAIQGPIAKFNDTQAKIRNFIRYAYTELGTEYVLLGGDADYTPSDNIVPLRKLFAVEDGLPLGSRDLIEEDIPSDVYYACLDGNFNRDGDDHWGENATQNGYNDEDEADLLCEVYVGRACVDADDEVSNFVMKTLAYDTSTDPYIYTGLMVGEYLGFPGVSAWGGNYKDLIIPLFPEDFVVDTLYDRDGTWSKYQLMNLLNTQTPHLINHLGHGNVQYALKMGVNDIASLTNDNYFFVYSQTCLAGSFDNTNTDCAAEYFTVETPHGAFAVIMNARYGLGSENTLVSPSQVLDESFFTALFTENLHALGQANHYSKEDHIWHINENGIRWVYYETNLFGDPALQIKPHNKPPETPAAPSGPTTGVATVEYEFTVSPTIDPEGDDIYYWFDWDDGTNSGWLGPYPSGSPATASHAWTAAGDYEITVKAKDALGAESGVSPAHTITIIEGPILQIEGVTGGMLKVKATVKNTGGVAAHNIAWTMTLTGGLVLVGKERTGNILALNPGETREITSKTIIGLGKTVIKITATVPESSAEVEQNATILLI
ncbi:MAG TPA: PKD domain-containing protein, partial [Thermoplasmatales archaeon]|nr:PKD domain-containing protein [Thermoplasmatales archaeon]